MQFQIILNIQITILFLILITAIAIPMKTIKYKLKKIVAFRDSLLPDLEIWLNEFGYDTQEGSSQAAPAIGKNSTEEIQGRWLLRSFLEISAYGFYL
jgi:hypothetical protein